MAAERHAGRPQHVLRYARHELLDPRHRVAIVGVGLVPLEHRELGLVLVRDALVAEVLADLVDPLETADDEALEVELVRDAEVVVRVELVVVRDERLREAAPVERLQDRRLDLDEAVRVEPAADCGDHARANHRLGARLLVHEQIEVALAVAELDVRDPVERVRERAPVLSEQDQLVDGDGRLAAAGFGGRADDSNDVAEVDVDVTRARRVAEQLDPPGAVDEVEEDELAACPQLLDPAGAAPPRRERPRPRPGRGSASAGPSGPRV